MAHRFDQLRKQLVADPRRRQKVEDYKRVMDVIASLTELRKQRKLTQVQIATLLNVKQPVVSQFESSSEINLTTLMRYVEALGGSLDLTVHFDDGDVHLARAEAS